MLSVSRPPKHVIDVLVEDVSLQVELGWDEKPDALLPLMLSLHSGQNSAQLWWSRGKRFSESRSVQVYSSRMRLLIHIISTYRFIFETNIGRAFIK